MLPQLVTISPTADQLHKIITYDYGFHMYGNSDVLELPQDDALP